ncbi:unnamed protein product, partial [Mesorhabditis spiculigera]
MDNYWHRDCIKCAKCHVKIFAFEGIEWRTTPDQRPICIDCHLDDTTPPCAGCKKPVGAHAWKALGDHWHHGCLTCTGCFKPFPENKFYLHEDRPYDIDCYHIKVLGKKLEKQKELTVAGWLRDGN